MYTKIGSLARRFGLTPQAIRNYETQGFILAERETAGDTRRYHVRNLKCLNSVRQYRALGFGTRDILELFSCGSLEEIEAKLAAQEKALRREAEERLRMADNAARRREDLRRARALLGRCERIAAPAFTVLITQEGQELMRGDALESALSGWVQHMPPVYEAVMVGAGAMAANDREAERRSGYCAEQGEAQALCLEQRHAMHFSAPLCVHTVCIRAPEHPSIEHVNRYLQENGLAYAGDALARCLAKTGERECMDGQIIPREVWYEYFIPVREV